MDLDKMDWEDIGNIDIFAEKYRIWEKTDRKHRSSSGARYAET